MKNSVGSMEDLRNILSFITLSDLTKLIYLNEM